MRTQTNPAPHIVVAGEHPEQRGVPVKRPNLRGGIGLCARDATGRSRVLRGIDRFLVGLGMAVCNLAGAQIGTQLALKHGARFIRKAFLAVVAILIAKQLYEIF